MNSNSLFGNRVLIVVVGIAILAILLVEDVDAAKLTVDLSGDPEQIRLQDMFEKPGRLEANGIDFQLINSDYFNITLDSSEPIKLILESGLEMVTMHIEPDNAASSTMITLGGFTPQTRYHKYEDNYHNHVAFITDIGGNYTYTQGLSKPHLIFIQPRASTLFINDNITGGDCALIGIWDADARICTLTSDPNETIQIDSNDITLDGNGHLITGSGTGSGVYLSGRSDVEIRDLIVRKFYNGIFLYSSSNITLSSNEVSSNNGGGISLWSSNNNKLMNNNASNNYGGFYLYYYSSENTLKDNNALNNRGGIYLSYGINTLDNNNASNNKNSGILLGDLSNNNVLTNNTASNNNVNGIVLAPSSYNLLSNNKALNNDVSGIILYYSSNNNLLTDNKVSDNDYNGISLNFSSNNNILTSNIVSNNNNSGITQGVTGNNFIYNNYFNNTNNAFDNGFSIWNTTKTAGTNIIGGPYIGGNFWAHPNGTGFSQTCADNDSDGICDSEYVLASVNIDHLPLAEAGEEPPVALCGPDKIRCENAGAPVQFNASASYDPDGTIISYYWEFGDGTNGTGMAPNHIYAIYRWNGTAYLPFIVNLTVTDDSGLTNRTSQKVVIWEAGDTNGDANVNILDASLVGLKWKGNEPCADLNNDGKVNIVDASIIGLNWGSVQACRSNLYCSPGSYCEKKTGNCAGNGTCQKRPDSCTDLYDPVCGCNGITYSNACYAAANGVSVAYKGVC